MHNPFTFKPTDPDDCWEDNWLSNCMAWFSKTFLPTWCQTPTHWTTRLVLYLWADCACCLAFRFLTVGIILGAGVAAIIALVVV